MRHRRADLHAFYGIDLHWRKQYRGLHTMVDVPNMRVDRESLLNALRAGRFEGRNGRVQLASSAQLDPALAARFSALNRRGQLLREAFRQVKRITEALGIRPPQALKSQLRRFF
jgi:hypothetical protein